MTSFVYLLPFLLPLVCFGLFAFKRMLRYLHIFQQEDYNPTRFVRWVVASGALDRKLSLAIFVLSLLVMAIPAFVFVMPYLTSLLFGLFCFFEPDPREVAKKKLVMTSRARRIFWAAYLLTGLAALAVLTKGAVWGWILAVQFIPFALALGNIILKPVEHNIQNRIMREASAKLASVGPKVIGITGSFGKTSVKHILGHILDMNAPTFYTPGSVNTLMGISRMIRENLRPGTKYFLVEMGAYGEGSIEKLCRLTPPDYGIVTALGDAHYERFKTLDAVARAKFELVQAVLAKGGRMAVHENVLAQPYARDFIAKHADKFLICGPGDAAQVKIGTVTQSTAGLTVAVQYDGKNVDLFAPLYGEAHAGNMALAFAASVECGIDPERAVAAMRTVPQIKHRLEVKPQPDGRTYIDDAFNSNPRGFAAALDVLALLGREKNARRILITPGIIELGDRHDAAHAELGAKAAVDADIALVVRGDRIPTFVDAFRKAAPQKPLHLVANLAEAQAWLRQNSRAPDIYLIENDLPDLGEARLVL